MLRHFILTVMTAIAVALPICASAEDANMFTMTSTAVHDQGTLPVLYSCDGSDVSPQLAWTNKPANTKTFALIVSDTDAPSGVFYHWVLFNIPNTASSLAQGVSSLPAGTVVGRNSFGKQQYNGPCPPKGNAHHYQFTLYALDTSLNLPAESDANAVLDAMQIHVLGKAELSASYSRR